MNKYEVGIMSNKWEVEAVNVDVAVCRVILEQQTNLPIAVYTKGENSKFSFIGLKKEDDKIKEFTDFLDANRKNIINAKTKLIA